MKCLHCDQENVIVAQFCVRCGKSHAPQASETQGKVACSCGAPLRADAKFCPHCGLRQGLPPKEAEEPLLQPPKFRPMLSPTSELDATNTVSGENQTGVESIVTPNPTPSTKERYKIKPDSDTIEGEHTEGHYLIRNIPLPGIDPRIVESVVRKELRDAFPVEMENVLNLQLSLGRRENVAHWVIRNDTLYLARIDGHRGVVDKQPVIADWVSEHIQLGRGTFDPIRGSAAGCQLEVVCGQIMRHRKIDTAMTFDGPVLEELPGGHVLFARELSLDPQGSRPSLQDFKGVELRKVCTACRFEAGLSHGDLAERIGMKRGNGGALAEWERGLRDLQNDRLDAVCRVLGIGVDEVSKREQATFEAAQKAWFEAPIRPWLTVRGRHYEFPDTFAPSVDAEAWARRCVHLAWTSGTLHLDRRRMVEVSAHEELKARPLPPEAEVLLTGSKLKSAKDEHSEHMSNLFEKFARAEK